VQIERHTDTFTTPQLVSH